MEPDFDRSKLNAYSERMLDRFLYGFPEETVDRLENTEKSYVPDGDRFIGAWYLEWLCPAGGYDWNVRLSSYSDELILHWGSDHLHFYWTEDYEIDIEAEWCLDILREIFAEQTCHVAFLQGGIFHNATICDLDEVETFLKTRRKPEYEAYQIKTWRGTYDRTVSLQVE